MDNEAMPTVEPVSTEPSPPISGGLLRNYISFIGMAIATAALTSIGLLVLIELSSGADNPYTVLVTYILLPSILIFGLAVLALGALLERRRRLKNPDAGIPTFPVLDLNNPARRRGK